jgi:hypothetical protein
MSSDVNWEKNIQKGEEKRGGGNEKEKERERKRKKKTGSKSENNCIIGHNGSRKRLVGRRGKNIIFGKVGGYFFGTKIYTSVKSKGKKKRGGECKRKSNTGKEKRKLEVSINAKLGRMTTETARQGTKTTCRETGGNHVRKGENTVFGPKYIPLLREDLGGFRYIKSKYR